MIKVPPYSTPEDCKDAAWIEECLKYRGVVLVGEYSHICWDWDGLPMDETCEHEWPCACYKADLEKLNA